MSTGMERPRSDWLAPFDHDPDWTKKMADSLKAWVKDALPDSYQYKLSDAMCEVLDLVPDHDDFLKSPDNVVQRLEGLLRQLVDVGYEFQLKHPQQTKSTNPMEPFAIQLYQLLLMLHNQPAGCLALAATFIRTVAPHAETKKRWDAQARYWFLTIDHETPKFGWVNYYMGLLSWYPVSILAYCLKAQATSEPFNVSDFLLNTFPEVLVHRSLDGRCHRPNELFGRIHLTLIKGELPLTSEMDKYFEYVRSEIVTSMSLQPFFAIVSGLSVLDIEKSETAISDQRRDMLSKMLRIILGRRDNGKWRLDGELVFIYTIMVLLHAANRKNPVWLEPVRAVMTEYMSILQERLEFQSALGSETFSGTFGRMLPEDYYLAGIAALDEPFWATMHHNTKGPYLPLELPNRSSSHASNGLQKYDEQLREAQSERLMRIWWIWRDMVKE